MNCKLYDVAFNWFIDFDDGLLSVETPRSTCHKDKEEPSQEEAVDFDLQLQEDGHLERERI